MRKRTGKMWIVGVLACLLTVLLLPGGSMKTEAATQVYDIWVCGEQVTSENLSRNDWSYEPETNKLTLKTFNRSYMPTISDAAIFSRRALNLVLEGTNKVENNSKDGNQQMGILVQGTLTISGEGSLEVQGESDASCYGIYVSGKLVINGGSIVAIGKNSGTGVGIYATGDITINDGSVSATGNKGIFCGGTYEQNGGDVMTISNNDNTNRYGTGLYAKKAITITRGKLSAIGSQNENSKKSFGIECDGIYTQTGGEVEAASNNRYAGSDGEKIGLKAAGIKFEGDTLTLEGNTRAYKITGRSDSEQTNEKNITWTKASVLKASDFTITQPDGIYNGKEQEFTVTPKAGINCGAVTVKYYRYNKNNGTYASMYSRKPTALGDYKFELNVTGSSSYAATTLQDESWKFTIGYGTLTDDLYTMEGLVESNGKKWAKGNVLVRAADGYQLTNVENKNYQYAMNFSSGYHEIWIKENTVGTGRVYRGTIDLDFTLDQEGPVINGLENEKTYYNQDVTFTVTDEGSGVDKVTAKRQDATEKNTITAETDGTYKLAGNGWYEIQAYDKVGNSSSIKVCVVTCEHNSNYFGTVSYDWKNDATGRIISCTASTICSSCKQEVKETVTVDAGITETIVQKQSCTKPELITYTAKFERDGFQNQVKERVETAPASHKLQKVNAKAATCTDEGNIEYYKCSECGLCFKNSDGTEQLTEDATKIAKKDHEGAEPVVYTWNEKHTTCTAVIKCKYCGNVIDKAEGTISSETTKEAGCTVEGEITYTAAFKQGSAYAYKDQTEKVTVAALGHVEPEDDGDCTTAVICERCKAVIKDAKAHDWSDSWTKDASGHWHACQNDGCTKKEDEAAHTPDIQMPTDDTDQKCTVCGYIIAPKKSHEHTLQKIEATEATCTTPGKQEYYKCETCGHFFADEAATREVMEGDMIIPARGHDYANLVYTWSEDYTTCTAVQKCNNCDTVKATEKVNSTSSVTQSQSCTAPELTTYTATFTSETFAVQKKVVQTKEAAGHMPGDWIVDRLATVTEEGSRHKECSVCKAIVKTEIIEKLPYISSDTTKPDSSNEETVTNRTEINAAGKSVSVTTTVRKDASGKVISTVQTKEIVDAAKDTSVTVTSVTDGEGKTSVKADVVTSGTKSASGTKGTISSDVVAQITEAAGTTDIVITQKVVDQDGKIAYTVSINAKDLTSGEKFIVVKYNKKTGKYTLCNKKIYKVTDAGVSLTIKDSGSYQLISEADAAKLVKEILATVKPAKKSKTVKEGNAASFAWSKELDTANVSKITYSSTDNSIAKIGKNGKITAKNAGKVTLKATVTLKNGKKKVVSMKLSVRSK